ncbi:MAG: class I SAM-dependent methyltransferase [Pirellulales bacterium]
MQAADQRLTAAYFAEVEAVAERITGWLQPSEIRFLAMVAALPTTRGTVVELGAFSGKSSAVLAYGSRLTAQPGLISIDPYEQPDRRGFLQQAGLDELVDFRQQYSGEFWQGWHGPIRLLWHDGAIEREVVSADVQSALPHLADGAIVAFHDVRNTTGERLHPYCDQVLASPHFGASGICGSIGWSQYHVDPEAARPHAAAKEHLLSRLRRLRPFHNLDRPRPLSRLAKMHYKLLRWCVPHRPVSVQQWRSLQRAAA